MPRFVVLRHELPPGGERGSHWDVMFERGASLRTWAIERSPDAAIEQPAQALPDHRPAYLTYEGPVSNQRGAVTRWDEGEYVFADDEPQSVTARVDGGRLRGTIELTRHDDETWHYRYRAADAATES